MKKPNFKKLYSSLSEVTGLIAFIVLDTKLATVDKFGQEDPIPYDAFISLVRELHTLIVDFTSNARLEKYNEILQETELGLVHLLVSASQKFIFVAIGNKTMKIGMIRAKMEKTLQGC